MSPRCAALGWLRTRAALVNRGESYISDVPSEQVKDLVARGLLCAREDFDCAARTMLRDYNRLDDLKTATSCANGLHSWQGRAAYELLHAVAYLTLAAAVLLQHGDEAYIREKLQNGLRRITGALYEGVRHSNQSSQFIICGTYFPNEADR